MDEDEKRFITPVNIAFVVINVVVYLILEAMGDTLDAGFMLQHGAMYPPAVLEYGQWYRLLTHAFIHYGLPHLVNNMVLLIAVGSYLERALGKIRYLILYLLCAVGAGGFSMMVMVKTGKLAVSGGASGVVFGVIGALLFMIIKNKGRLEDLPLKRYLIMIALALYYGFTTAGVDNAAHVGGLIIGFILCGIFVLLDILIRRKR